MAIDEDLLTLAPTAIALVLFILGFIYILTDFQAKRVNLERVDAGLSIAQIIIANKSGVVREINLPTALAVNSQEYSVFLNLTDISTGSSWVHGSSNGSTIVSLPLLLERLNGSTNQAKLFVRIGLK